MAIHVAGRRAHKPYAVFLLCAAALVHASVPTAIAQSWPTKPVRIIAPFAAGGTSDMLGRLVAQKLGEHFGQSFIIENRPGAGGAIGAELVAKAAPSGYTLVVSGIASHAIAPALMKNLSYDPVRDFTHTALLGGPPGLLLVHPSVPARDFKEFLALAKARPGQLSYGSPGNGTQGHMLVERFKQLATIDLRHVPYKGGAAAFADMIAGHVPVSCCPTLSTAVQQMRAGKARALAVSSRTRVPELSDVPTFAELGYPDLTASIWFGLSGPAGMPQDIVGVLNHEVRRILQLPEVRERLRPEAIEPGDLDPPAFHAFVAQEVKRWAPLVRALAASVD
jgi:tripartite-type tricarboxylate transporter receptor subunit TctC